MKKYTYLISNDAQTLTRVGEPMAVRGDSGVAEVEFIIPSGFVINPTEALWRAYYRLPGKREAHFVTLPTPTAMESGDWTTTWTVTHAVTQSAGRLAFSLTAFSGETVQWDSRVAILQINESVFEGESEESEEPYIGRLATLEGDMAQIRGEWEGVQDEFDDLKEVATAGVPVAVEEAADMINDGHIYIYTGDEDHFATGHVYYYVDGTLTDGGVYGGTNVDATLTVSGQAADAKVTGDKIAEIKEDLTELQEKIDEFSGGLTPAIKDALLNCFKHVGWDHGTDATYYNALEEALYADEVKRISAVFTPGTHEVYTTDNIESLRNFLVVTATYNDDTQAVVTDYTLEGDISNTGTKTITVKYGRTKTTTFIVSVVTNTTGILYEWDFTKGLTDLRQGHTVKLYTGYKEINPDGTYEGTTPPTLTSSGVQFNDISQGIKIFDRDYSTNNLFGKTIQVDVASFNFKGNSTNDNIRFIVFRDPAERWSSTPAVTDGLIYRKGDGWSFYDGYQWKDSIYTGMSSANAISGHKISAFLASNGAMKLYVDGSSKGTGQAQTLNNHTWQGLWIGDGSKGGTFRDALITGIRIYNGEVAN